MFHSPEICDWWLQLYLHLLKHELIVGARATQGTMFSDSAERAVIAVRRLRGALSAGLVVQAAALTRCELD